MSEFELNQTADAAGTHRIGEIQLPPKRLVDVFGMPGEGDGYKVSGLFVFSDTAGNIYTVYDWKATSLYDDGMEPGDEEYAITPDDFWSNWNPDSLQIGGTENCDLEAFRSWLLESTR